MIVLASAEPGEALRMTLVKGDHQRRRVNASAAEPVRVWLPAGNPSQTVSQEPIHRQSVLIDPGQANSLEDPIILPLTLGRTSVPFDGGGDLELPMPGNPGFALTIGAWMEPNQRWRLRFIFR